MATIKDGLAQRLPITKLLRLAAQLMLAGGNTADVRRASLAIEALDQGDTETAFALLNDRETTESIQPRETAMVAETETDAPVWGLPPDLKIEPPSEAGVLANPWHLKPDVWQPIWDATKDYMEGLAIINCDTGSNNHNLLPQRLADASFISGESPRDGHSHGTHTTGTSVATGGYGVAPGAGIINAKVLSNGGRGSSQAIANGIEWGRQKAKELGVYAVLNLSLGGGSGYGPTNEAIDRCYADGIIVNASAGNSGFNGSSNTIGWPAKYSGCGCIAATREDGSIAGFSSGGAQIDVATPGQNIQSCSNRSAGGIVVMSGTSMSCPFKSGLDLLIVALNRANGAPAWVGIEDMRAFYRRPEFMHDRGRPGFDPSFGWGVPDYEKIITYLSRGEIEWV